MKCPQKTKGAPFVVEQIDLAFPNIGQVKLFTKLAKAVLLNKYRFRDHPEISELVENEQQGLNDMWCYLGKRDDQ